LKAFRIFFLGFFIFTLAFNATAQDIEAEKKRAHLLFSPFHTVYNHYSNLKNKDFHPEKAALSLNPYFAYPTQKAKEDLAIKLGQIIDGNGLLIDEKKIPKENNYLDSTSKKNLYTPFPRFKEIYLEKIGNQWFYSATTIEAIPRLYDKTFPFESERLSKLMTQGTRFWGLTWEQYLALVLLLIIPFALHWALTRLLALLLRIFIRPTEQEIRENKIRKLSRPISLFLVFWLIEQLIPIFQFPALVSYYLITFIHLCMPVFAVIMGVGLINVLTTYLHHLAKKRPNIWYEQLIPFLRTTLQVLVIVLGLIYLLEVLNLNVTAVVAGLSIGGLAVALAAQDTIKNFFGSIMIFVDRSFKVGDWIVAEGLDGEVEEIGVRSTRIRTFYNSVLHVPNGKMADMIIDNLGMRIYRRYRTMLNINYNTHPVLIKAFVKGLKELVLKNPNTRKDFYGINFYEYGNHSLNILFNIFFTVPTFEQEWDIREEINFQILELATELGIKFAFPTQTLNIESLPNSELKKMEVKLDEAEIDKKLEKIIKKYYPDNS
jgi:MscS family membrane protein